jgi:transposase
MEKDVKVKERMLPVLDVVYQGRIAAHVAIDLHRRWSRACQWLKRYDRQGLDGLKDIPKMVDRQSYQKRCRVRDKDHTNR